MSPGQKQHSEKRHHHKFHPGKPVIGNGPARRQRGVRSPNKTGGKFVVTKRCKGRVCQGYRWTTTTRVSRLVRRQMHETRATGVGTLVWPSHRKQRYQISAENWPPAHSNNHTVICTRDSRPRRIYCDNHFPEQATRRSVLRPCSRSSVYSGNRNGSTCCLVSTFFVHQGGRATCRWCYSVPMSSWPTNSFIQSKWW